LNKQVISDCVYIYFLLVKLAPNRFSLFCSAADNDNNVPGSILTDALRFHQEGHPEFKYYNAPLWPVL